MSGRMESGRYAGSCPGSSHASARDDPLIAGLQRCIPAGYSAGAHRRQNGMREAIGGR